MRSLKWLERTLDGYHRPLVDHWLQTCSPIAGPQFANNFNLAGHFAAWQALADAPSSLWGIDRCLRIQETVDHHHSRVFHMGVFARALTVPRPVVTPMHDPRFQALQRAALTQFLSLIKTLGLDFTRLQASCFGGATIGGHVDGRDRLLRRRYRLPPDRCSAKLLRGVGIRVIVVPAILSLYIRSAEGALVGPRLEFFCDDLEFATMVFASHRVHRGRLAPIHYVAAYGIGLERVLAILNKTDFLHGVPRYAAARRLLERRMANAGSAVMRPEVTQILFGLEALAALPARLSKAQRALVSQMKRELKVYILELGLSYRDILGLYRHFQGTAD